MGRDLAKAYGMETELDEYYEDCAKEFKRNDGEFGDLEYLRVKYLGIFD